jgi:hypothetical protein
MKLSVLFLIIAIKLTHYQKERQPLLQESASNQWRFEFA